MTCIAITSLDLTVCAEFLPNRLILNNGVKRKMWRIRKSATLRAQNATGSRPSGKLPGLGRHFDLLAFFDKQGNADFQAGFQPGDFSHAAARRVSTRTRFGVD